MLDKPTGAGDCPPVTITPIDRRRLLAGLASGVGALWISGGWSTLHAAAARAATARVDDPFLVLTPTEAEVLDAMAARIIPTDDTPGAREANVVRFMDQALATFTAEQRPLVAAGVVDLQARVASRYPGVTSFAALDPGSQVELLQALDAQKSDFFEAVRVGTITGMFADPKYGGNRDKIGWQLLGFDDRFAWQAPFGDYDRE